jgi:hypothetical protein
VADELTDLLASSMRPPSWYQVPSPVQRQLGYHQDPREPSPTPWLGALCLAVGGCGLQGASIEGGGGSRSVAFSEIAIFLPIL